MITGYPELADYYRNQADAYIHIDGESGTFLYTETRRDMPDLVYVSLDGAFSDFGGGYLLLNVAGTQMLVQYTLEDGTLSFTAGSVTAVFTDLTPSAEAVQAYIPTSSWTLTGGTWWNLLGSPDLQDYYENGSVVSLSFDADKGTVAYTETGINTKSILFALNGTYTADATTATVNGGGIVLTAGYSIAGDILYVYTDSGMGIFTRAN